MNDVASNLYSAIKSNLVCLHPTDSIPGLTFDPNSGDAQASLERIKGRVGKQGYIGLVADFDVAQKFWQPLPGKWKTILSEMWPCPLSVGWLANEKCPRSLLADDGTACFRFPSLKGQEWLRDVMRALDFPLPTTSVNRTGTPAIVEWGEAVDWAKSDSNVFSYELPFPTKGQALPSTLIKIAANGTFSVLRPGCFDVSKIEKYFSSEGSRS
ncbi:MAG: L-threonylcarbamoyladenylate synthase [Oligoflexales bacterium]